VSDTLIALQLYTVRDYLAKDYVGTLRKAREIGYDLVQLTGTLPFGAAQMAGILSDVGLGVAGIHVGGARLQEDLEQWMDYARSVGTRDLVWPFVPAEQRGTREDWLRLAAVMDELGARCAEEGLRLSYHNHSFEFQRFGDTCALDLLFSNTSPDRLYAELDTYWVKHGGEDPVAYIRKYAGRMPLLHVKDMADDDARSFAEIGRGTLDWPAIHRAADGGGVECYCVEQDTCAGDPLESARVSLEFLHALVSG
jgi:sugar phosphate isomerase/epimerase